MGTLRQFPVSQQESYLAEKSIKQLMAHTQKNQGLMISVQDDDQIIELPAGVVNVLMEILTVMSAGQAVTLIREGDELTTVQAAEILKVSRPFLIKLLEEGKIPHHKVGKHRRIRTEDVLAYKSAIDAEREAILDELAREAQETQMGYS